MSEKQDKVCVTCHFYKIPSVCPDYHDLKDGWEQPEAHSCDKWYPAKKTKGKKQEKKQYKDSGVSETGCFEAVYVDGKPAFLVQSQSGFSTAETVDVKGEKFYPKEVQQFPYEPYGVFEGSVPSREELFQRVRAEFDTWVDVEEIWKDTMSSCVLLTYHQEKLQTTPYLMPFGDNESGKTTIIMILSWLCYRPMSGLTIPPADIFGYLEDSDSIGCILEDEIQGVNKDIDKIKLYKSGYKQGAVVPRTILTQGDPPRIMKYYHTFCFKACASEQIPQVKGFNERFLFIPMVEGSPKKEWSDIKQEDLERLHALRNTLLKWRMLSRTEQLPNLELPFKGRLKELWKPILQISHGLTCYDRLFKFVEVQRNERLGSRQNTLEGHIVKVIVDYYNGTSSGDSIPFQTVWDMLQVDLDGKIDDRKPHVMDTSEFFDVTKNKVGYRLREVLSGRTTVVKRKDGSGGRVSVKAYVFDVEKLKRVAKKYGYELSTKLLTTPSSPIVVAPESMEKECRDNVEKGPQKAQKLGILSNSVDVEKGAFQVACPVCAAQGKQLLFNSDHDLALHLDSCHRQGSYLED